MTDEQEQRSTRNRSLQYRTHKRSLVAPARPTTLITYSSDSMPRTLQLVGLFQFLLLLYCLPPPPRTHHERVRGHMDGELPPDGSPRPLLPRRKATSTVGLAESVEKMDALVIESLRELVATLTEEAGLELCAAALVSAHIAHSCTRPPRHLRAQHSLNRAEPSRRPSGGGGGGTRSKCVPYKV